MKRVLSILSCCIAILLLCNLAHAQKLSCGGLYTDNMVVQQLALIPIWGNAVAGTEITITNSWENRSYKTTTNSSGRWEMKVQTPSATFSPQEIRVTTLNESLVISNILVGDVWLASGQSNMTMPLKGFFCQPVENATNEILGAGKYKINFINTSRMGAFTPIDTFSASWQRATMQTVGECSAVAWFFARTIQKSIHVPIGIINASYGGSNVESWMPRAACNDFKDIIVPPDSKEVYASIRNIPTVLYNGMINPLVGYPIKGVVWYQGESNVFNVGRYATTLSAMIREWRIAWHDDFPFYIAQITPFNYDYWSYLTPQKPDVGAYIREAQGYVASSVPNTYMSVNLDLGHESQIHPARKKEVGQRMALLVLSKTYGLSGFEYESPQYHHMEIEGDKIILHFENIPGGLTSFEKDLQEFEIAGANRVFHKAKAYIAPNQGGVVIVSSQHVKEPQAVRYAFKNWAVGELFGTGGLPVSSFRTDDW